MQSEETLRLSSLVKNHNSDLVLFYVNPDKARNKSAVKLKQLKVK